MSKVRLLDLFEKELEKVYTFELEKVYTSGFSRYILVAMGWDFQNDDLIEVAPGYWQKIDWSFATELNNNSRKNVACKIFDYMKKGLILTTNLRRPVHLFDEKNRYLRLGDVITKGDCILPSGSKYESIAEVEENNFLMNKEYTETIDNMLGSSDFPKFQKIIRRIELVK